LLRRRRLAHRRPACMHVRPTLHHLRSSIPSSVRVCMANVRFLPQPHPQSHHRSPKQKVAPHSGPHRIGQKATPRFGSSRLIKQYEAGVNTSLALMAAEPSAQFRAKCWPTTAPTIRPGRLDGSQCACAYVRVCVCECVSVLILFPYWHCFRTRFP
jgi:hypothetical protein